MGFRQYGRRIAMVLVIVLPALLACTDDDVIGIGTGVLGLTLQSVGGSGRYDVSVLQITGLIYRATDPDVQESLAGDALGLLTFPINIDLGNPNIVTVDVGVSSGVAQPIVAGTYEVFELEVVQFSLRDQAPLMHGPECIEMVDVLTENPGTLTQASSTRVILSQPFRFTVDAERRTNLLLQIDVPGIIGLFEDQFRCTEQALCSGGTVLPPCIVFYTLPTSAQLEPFFTVSLL